jgi:hypothetical protein
MIKQNTSLKINVPLAMTSHVIFEMFNSISRQNGFEVIENDQSFATSVHKGDNSKFSKLFSSCNPFSSFTGASGDAQELVEDLSFEGQRSSVAQ